MLNKTNKMTHQISHLVDERIYHILDFRSYMEIDSHTCGKIHRISFPTDFIIKQELHRVLFPLYNIT